MRGWRLGGLIGDGCMDRWLRSADSDSVCSALQSWMETSAAPSRSQLQSPTSNLEREELQFPFRDAKCVYKFTHSHTHTH